MHDIKEIRENLKEFSNHASEFSNFFLFLLSYAFESLYFLSSINFTEKIDNSYKINNGIAKPIWVIGSGGVNNAAAAKIITTTYFLLFFKNSESISPTLANKLKTTGNWKLIPKANINFITNERYSFTFASNCIGKFVDIPELSKDKKNFIANGMTR